MPAGAGIDRRGAGQRNCFPRQLGQSSGVADPATALVPRGLDSPLSPGSNRQFLIDKHFHPFVMPLPGTALQSLAVPLAIEPSSYELTRRYLERNEMPPPERVRTEDFLAAMDYGYPRPSYRGLGLTVTGGQSPISGGRFLCCCKSACRHGRAALPLTPRCTWRCWYRLRRACGGAAGWKSSAVPWRGCRNRVAARRRGPGLRADADADGGRRGARAALPGPRRRRPGQADSPAVRPPLPASLGGPVISGDPRAGQQLTCGSGAWDGAYSFTYAWFRGDGIQLGDRAGVHRRGRRHRAVLQGHGGRCGDRELGDRDRLEPAGGPQPENRTLPAITGDPHLRGTAGCAPGTWAERGCVHVPLAARRRGDRGRDAGDLRARRRRRRQATALRGHHRRRVRVQPGDRRRRSGLDGGARDQRRPARARGRCTAPRAAGTGPTTSRTSGCATVSRWAARRRSRACSTRRTSGTTIACEVRADGLVADSRRRRDGSRAEEPRRAQRRGRPAPGPRPDAATRVGGTTRAGSRYALTYRWLRDGVAIAGETAATHTVVVADLAAALSCEVRAEAVSPAASPAVTPKAPENLVAPALTGRPRIGGTLTCGDGTWDAVYPITARRWLRAGGAIAGATGAIVCRGRRRRRRGDRAAR